MGKVDGEEEEEKEGSIVLPGQLSALTPLTRPVTTQRVAGGSSVLVDLVLPGR